MFYERYFKEIKTNFQFAQRAQLHNAAAQHKTGRESDVLKELKHTPQENSIVSFHNLIPRGNMQIPLRITTMYLLKPSIFHHYLHKEKNEINRKKKESAAPQGAILWSVALSVRFAHERDYN